MDAAHTPYLTTVYDSSADVCQLNADVYHQNAEFRSTSPAANVCHSLPVSKDSRAVVSAAGQSQTGLVSSAVDEQGQLTQYPLADLSSALVEQTLVGIQTPSGSTIQLSQYTLSDNSSELVSLPQFHVVPGSHHEADDDTATVERGDSDSRVEIQESRVQQLSVDQSSLSLSVSDVYASDQHGTDSMMHSSADAVVNRLSGDQGKHVDTDLLVLLNANKSSLMSRSLANRADFSETVDSSDRSVESDGRCLASCTSPSVVSHMRSDDTGTQTDKTDHGSTVLDTRNPQSVTMAGSKAVSPEAKILSSVTGLKSVNLSAVAVSLPPTGNSMQPTDNKLPDSGCMPLFSSAFVDQGCSGQLDVFSDACKVSDMAAVVDLEVPVDHNAVTSDSAVSKLVEMVTDDNELTGNQVKLLPLERSGADDAESFRNAADGSETTDVLSTAVQSSMNISHIATAQSRGSVIHSAHHGIETRSDDGVCAHSPVLERSITVTQGCSVSGDQQPVGSVISDTNGDKVELLAHIESQPQHITVTTRDTDLALPLEHDSGSELDDDQLGDSVKMILAKYRIRRGPVGSDSMPVPSSAKTDDVLMHDVDDSRLLSGRMTESKVARDIDTCSDSSDDTLAVRVKALLLQEQQQSSGKMLQTTTTSEVSQSTSKVCSVCSSQSASVDYSNLSRELDEIQMNLDSMRHSAKSSLGSQQSSISSPRLCTPLIDSETSLTQEPICTLVQQKTCLDQSLQDGVVSHAGDSLHVDYHDFFAKTDAATSDLKQADAGTARSQSGHQHEMSLTSGSSTGADTKPVTALRAELDKGNSQDSMTSISKDLLQSETDVKTVQRPVQQPMMTLSNSSAFTLTTASGTTFAHSGTSLPGQYLHECFEGRNEFMSTADEDSMFNTGSLNMERIHAHNLLDQQNSNISDSSRDVQDSSTMQCILRDNASEVSSLQTDICQSESTSYTCLDDFRSARVQKTSVEDAVKELEQSLSNLIHARRHDASLASNACSYLHEAELPKWSTFETTHQLPEISDDEYRQNESGLNRSFSESCGLSPVSKHGLFDTMRSVHPPLTMQLVNTSAAQSDQGIEPQSPVVCNDSSSSRSFDGNMQQTESSAQHRIEDDKQTEYQIVNRSTYSDTSKSPYVLNARSVGSSLQTVAYDAQFVSTGHSQFMPLAELPPGPDSSDSGSYDGDNEQLLTDQQSYDGNPELRTYSTDGGQQLSTDRTLGNCEVDINVSCSAQGTQLFISQSPALVNLLQPYQ